MKKKSYTPIEIIVVCTIILVIAAIVIPAILDLLEKNDPKPTDDWVIVLSDSGNQLYNCRQIVTESNGNVKVVLSDGSKLTLSSSNCIVLENASEDLLYAMKRQYVDTTAPVETTTEETSSETTTTEETATTTTTTSETTTTTIVVTTTITTTTKSSSSGLTSLGSFKGTYYSGKSVPCKGGSGRTLIDCSTGGNGVKGSVASKLVYQNYGYKRNGERTTVYLEIAEHPSMNGWYYVDDCNAVTSIIDFYFYYNKNCPFQKAGVVSVKAYI